MHISSMYKQLDLKDPNEFKAEVETSALYSDDLILQRNILLEGRRTGKTTRAILLSFSNLFKQKNTVILCHNFADMFRHYKLFLDYAKIILPDLLKENNKQLGYPKLKITYKNNFVIFAEIKDNTPFYDGSPLISIPEKTIFIDDTL